MEMSKRQYEYLLFAVVMVLTVFRFSYYGLSYIPYLDDYIQYSYYPMLENSWQRVYMGGVGVLFTRPLAGLFDLMIWSRLSSNLGLAVGIISILHGISAVLFYKAFKLCGLRVGALFLAIYTLIPVNVEATYWLSASSRIVVSMFLMSLCAYFGANKKAPLFFLFNFLSVWFYEQTAILSFAISCWICLRQNKRWWPVFPVISVFLLLLFYLRFGFLGDNAHRLSAAQPEKICNNILLTLNSFICVLSSVQFRILTRGFARGFMRIALDFSLLWLMSMTVLSILFFSLSRKCDNHNQGHRYDFMWGILFMLVPILPFFVLGEDGFNLRNAAPCFLGLAVAADRALSGVSKKYICGIGAALVFWFSVAGVSEVSDYNYTAGKDFAMASQIAENISADIRYVRVKVTTPKYYTQNAPFRDHIMSMTGSDWGITGIVRALSKNEKVIIEKIN